MSRKRFIILIGVVIGCFILVLMAVTNPSKNEYLDWANRNIVSSNANDLFNNIFPDMSDDFEIPNLFGNTQDSIETATKVSNFVFFTIYETNTDNVPYKTLGIFKNFFLLNGNSKTQNGNNIPKNNIPNTRAPSNGNAV